MPGHRRGILRLRELLCKMRKQLGGSGGSLVPSPSLSFLSLAVGESVGRTWVVWGLASYPGHVGGGKSGLVSTVCACAKNPMISWGIVYHRLRTVNLYRIAPKHFRLELIQRTWQVKAKTLIKRSSSLFVVLEREISR